MRTLYVFIEINGKSVFAGNITGNSVDDACFSYDREYLSKKYPSISISLPISSEAFTAEQTKNFFEGLLPEGFARKSVASWIHAQEEDYLTILSVLGSECLGALRISEEKNESRMASYKLLSLDEVKALAKEGVSKSTEIVTSAHLSLTGASGKVGLYFDEANDRWYQPIGNAPSTHIVKQSHVRLSGIVTNEQISLLTAKKLGIEIPESFILNTGSGKDSEILFATKRYDRMFLGSLQNNLDGIAKPNRLHQEDLAQALGIAGKDKYEIGDKQYLPEIFKLLRGYVSNPIKDQLKLWDILIYDFLVGNTDNHIKNLSLLYSPNLREVKLAPAYDIISTTIYPGSNREMAIGIGGKRNIDQINEKDFLASASAAGLGKNIAGKHFDALANKFENALTETALELTAQGFTEVEIIKEKILQTGGYAHI